MFAHAKLSWYTSKQQFKNMSDPAIENVLNTGENKTAEVMILSSIRQMLSPLPLKSQRYIIWQLQNEVDSRVQPESVGVVSNASEPIHMIPPVDLLSEKQVIYTAITPIQFLGESHKILRTPDEFIDKARSFIPGLNSVQVFSIQAAQIALKRGTDGFFHGYISHADQNGLDFKRLNKWTDELQLKPAPFFTHFTQKQIDYFTSINDYPVQSIPQGMIDIIRLATKSVLVKDYNTDLKRGDYFMVGLKENQTMTFYLSTFL